MDKIILVAGMPGSGKTFLANKLQQETPNCIVIDDLSRMLRVDYPGIKAYEILSQFMDYEVVLLPDPSFCDSKYKSQITMELKRAFPQCEIHEIYFENNPEQCMRNVERRNDKRKVDKHLKHMSVIYEIPKEAKPLRVWKPD